MSDTNLLKIRLVESFAPPPLRLSQGAAPQADCGMALLWLDIVGSTPITRHFLESGPAGIEQLAALLQHHFDTLIATIIAHGGIPLMFAGDGLLSGWHCAADAPREAVLRAAACGQAILAAPGAVLPSGEPLSLHAALALGPCRTAEIGGGTDRLHVTVGAGLADLQATTIARTADRLLVSPAARAALGDAAEVAPAGPNAVILATLCGAPAPAPLAIPPLSPSAHQRLAALVPLPIASRLERGHLGWMAELRRATVVFAALPGLDHAAPDIVPQLEAVAATVGPVVRRHDGFLHHLGMEESGANLLILFGIPPVAHADDPARAVRCAIDLRDALRGLGQRSSFGVATGRVFCGLVGNDIFRVWTIYGEAVNLAARLKGLQQGTIQCDEATVRGSRDGVVFVPLGRSQVRGVGPAVPIWTPRRQDRVEGGMPMHGREQELAKLLAALHAAAAGLRQTVLVEADSGMGKSSLLAELQQHAAAVGAAVLAGHADPIERHVPYRGWRGVFVRLLALDPATPEPVQREAALAALGAEFAPRAALLNAVLPLDLPETAEMQALASVQRASLRLTLLIGLLRRTAAERPLLVTIDDGHWLDEESWTLAEAAAQEVTGLCLVVAMQPLEDDSRPRALAAVGALRLGLGDLTDEEQDRLALTRLGAERMAPDLSALLRGRARGHPLFCLELAQALRDEGLVEVVDGTCRFAPHTDAASLPLPDTVHGTVMRRIDRLDPDSQLTLKVASAAGLRFPTTLVAEIHPTARAEHATVARHLTLHHRIGLLLPDQIDEWEGYAFRHGITRDVAYELMLYTQRRQLHHEIAAWYERNCAADLGRVYALLAHHLEAAEEPEQAAEYLRLEAERIFGFGLVRQSVAIALHGAHLLGARLPTDGAGLQQAIGREMEQIAGLLGDRLPEDLAELALLEDPRAARLIPLLLSIAPYAYQSQQPELFALLGATCLRLTLEHGQGPFTPDVYAMYSAVYAALSGDRQGAAAWSRLGLRLQAGREADSFARCAFIHIWFHNHWSGTLDEGIALARAGAEAGLAHGEVTYGCFNLSACAVLLTAAGRPIAEVISVSETHLARNGGRVRNASFTLMLELQSARALAGQTLAPDSLSDAATDEAGEFAAMHDAGLSNQVACYHVAKLRLAALAGDWRGALAWAERARTLLPFFAGQPAEVVLVQYQGVAALAEAAFGAPEDVGGLRAEGWDCAEQLRSWEALNEPWLGPKADLLEGLLEAAAGRHVAAQSLLRAAAHRAAATGHCEDKAVALEFLARTQRAAGEVASALPEALAAYADWGAEGKRSRLAAAFGE